MFKPLPQLRDKRPSRYDYDKGGMFASLPAHKVKQIPVPSDADLILLLHGRITMLENLLESFFNSIERRVDERKKKDC